MFDFLNKWFPIFRKIHFINYFWRLLLNTKIAELTLCLDMLFSFCLSRRGMLYNYVKERSVLPLYLLVISSVT